MVLKVTRGDDLFWEKQGLMSRPYLKANLKKQTQINR